MPFLSVITRHLAGRIELLKRNRESLAAQTDPDYEQITMADEIGRGFGHAHDLLIQALPFVHGDYVLILDDDDFIQAADMIETLKAITLTKPPIVIFRGLHADFGILPSYSWGQAPKLGDVGCFDFIMRADVFREFVKVTSANAYAHDYFILAAAFERHGSKTAWLDKVMCAADRRRNGAIADA